ncbi:GNAT family N-acetyltransferase [Polluticaenibacter yanchengensis]|uniref:GNAT family N-acetyltransferase n=1 Tax=Polluticaenibacter yanchengensis TaxID=3014562 RepID=A0ABT4UKM0_9BACT|nr:GNAT family N-acetyltransferase [Chitinophagaceae bacterium LY-5]
MTQEVLIRPFSKADKGALLNIITLNVPAYFAASEVEDYRLYLENETEDYFVAVSGNEIIGAGGINYKGQEQIAHISWDLIHPAYQGKGTGKKLLTYRTDLITANYPDYKMIVRTSQLVYRFYEKNGFALREIHKDFWAEGYDMYYMVYEG